MGIPIAALSLARQCALSGLPVPVAEARFHPTRKWRFDWSWPAEKLAVEIDGGGFMNGRHSRGSGIERDCEKYAEALALGWRVLRVTPKHVKSGQALTWITKAVIHMESFDAIRERATHGGAKYHEAQGGWPAVFETVLADVWTLLDRLDAIALNRVPEADANNAILLTRCRAHQQVLRSSIKRWQMLSNQRMQRIRELRQENAALRETAAPSDDRVPSPSAPAWQPPPPLELENTARFILDRFTRDEADGYQSRDRQFVIALLEKALPPPPASPSQAQP